MSLPPLVRPLEAGPGQDRSKIRRPKSEIRPAATARQRGEKKPETRNPMDKPTPGPFCVSAFEFRISFGCRPSGFGLCPRRVREKFKAALPGPGAHLSF